MYLLELGENISELIFSIQPFILHFGKTMTDLIRY